MKMPAVFLLCIVLFAGVFPASAVVDKAVKTSYICRDLEGRARWQANTEIKNKQDDVYIMVEKAEGYYSGFSGRITWVAEMEFMNSGDIVRPIRLDKRIFDAGGNMIRREKQEFDLANNTGVCTHEDPTRNIFRTKEFKFSKNVVNRLSLGLYTQKFLERRKTNEKVQMVSEEPGVYEIELRMEGEEVIKANGREMAAYRVCIDPQLGPLNFVKAFLPKAYAWHSVGPKAELIRYTGLEGGINTKKVEVTVGG